MPPHIIKGVGTPLICSTISLFLSFISFMELLLNIVFLDVITVWFAVSAAILTLIYDFRFNTAFCKVSIRLIRQKQVFYARWYCLYNCILYLRSN